MEYGMSCGGSIQDPRIHAKSLTQFLRDSNGTPQEYDPFRAPTEPIPFGRWNGMALLLAAWFFGSGSARTPSRIMSWTPSHEHHRQPTATQHNTAVPTPFLCVVALVRRYPKQWNERTNERTRRDSISLSRTNARPSVIGFKHPCAI